MAETELVERAMLSEKVKIKNNQKPLVLNSDNGETEAIINSRIKVYEATRALNPSMFNKGIRNWEPPEKVALNPTDEVKVKLKIISRLKKLLEKNITSPKKELSTNYLALNPSFVILMILKNHYKNVSIYM